MTAASDSNDASDIFWPGYVDAVTNLAINLLFVIAVMSIVVISTIMQISKMKPDLFTPVENAVNSKPRSNDQTEKSSNPPSAVTDKSSPVAQAATPTLDKVLQDKAKAEEKVLEQNKQLAKLQKEIDVLKKSKPAPASKDAVGGTADIDAQASIVNAKDNRLQTKSGQNQLLQVGSGGVIVVFEKDVLSLSDQEAAELIEKIKPYITNEKSGFEIRVNTPKGFSESSRIAYYRVNEIRNVLIQNNIRPANIGMRVIESDNPSANNARVLVKPAMQ